MATASEPTVQSIQIVKEVDIAAPADVVWESILEEISTGMAPPEGPSLNMKIEAWPGGRWYRDLGNNTGHFWGHVQVIKPNKLLEITGPMFMSFPALSHIAYRLTESNGSTHLSLTHRAHGLFPKEYGDGVQKGWGEMVDRIRAAAQKKSKR